MTQAPLVQPMPEQHSEAAAQARKAGVQAGEMHVPLLLSQNVPLQQVPPLLQRCPKVRHALLPPPPPAPQSDCSQSQLALEHTPSEEPEPVPARQRPSHHPQESCAVQLVQSEAGQTVGPASSALPASTAGAWHRPPWQSWPAQQSAVERQPALSTPHEARQKKPPTLGAVRQCG